MLDEPEPVIKLEEESVVNDSIEKKVISVIRKYGGKVRISVLEAYFDFDICDVLIGMVKKGAIQVI